MTSAVGIAPAPGRAAATSFLSSGRARSAGLAVAALALVAAVVGSLAIGALDVPLSEVLTAFTAFDDSDAHVVVRELRVPRTEVGLLVGAALGASGALMQGVTRNPLAEPGILGINAGAAFSVVVAISLLGVTTIMGYTAFALLGAALTAVLVYALGASGRDGATPIKLALAGAVLSALLVSLTSAVLVFDAQTLDEFRFWIVGSIAGRDGSVVLGVLPVVAAGLLIALSVGGGLNALALGDDVARSLGLRVELVRGIAGVGFVLCAGGAVAAAGPIAFVGLTVPHVARALVGPDYRWIVPYSMLLGALLLLGADVVGRIVARPVELEVGIVTAVIGAPFFIALVRRGRLANL
ncbi:MAG: FecCD family ABC transporter permease [Solirubrobacteraceae bacterium]